MTLALRMRDVVAEVREGREAPLRILEVGAFDIPAGTCVGLTGPSGAGKTTLLHLAAGIARPVRGSIRWGEVDVTAMTEAARDRWRRTQVGFVFQEFHLVPELDVLANVLLPATFGAFVVEAGIRRRAANLIAGMGLPDPRRRVAGLSRGEQQRVAVARALLSDPAVILADEPTASLDAATGETIAALLVGAARRRGATLVAATHDGALLSKMDTVCRIEAGRLAAVPVEGAGVVA